MSWTIYRGDSVSLSINNSSLKEVNFSKNKLSPRNKNNTSEGNINNIDIKRIQNLQNKNETTEYNQFKTKRIYNEEEMKLISSSGNIEEIQNNE